MVGVVYKRRAEKGKGEKQNAPAGARKLSPGSAGHCPLTGFWVGSSKNVNLAWLCAMGLEKRRRTTNCNAVGLRCALGLCELTAASTIRPGHASLGGRCLGSSISSRQPSWHPQHTSSLRHCPDQCSGQDIRACFQRQKRLSNRGQPAF